MSDEFADVVDRVRERVEPDETEREAMRAAVETLVERAKAAVADRPVEADVVQVGSTARNTWLAGDRDIDLFVRFPPTLDRERLETLGLEVGHDVLPDGHEEFAEHPYVVGEYDGFDVDLVPCYDVADATAIQSAVDRTPFHTRYVSEHLTPELAGDVRVCKQFFTGIGVYGSDLRTRGFSGFLAELLVLEHDGFRPFVEAAADWEPPVRLDPEAHGTGTFDDPLVVIDPTDPERNVAAVLSETNVARLQHFARELLAAPRLELFTPEERDPLDASAVRDRFETRATTPVAVRFPAPDVVDDQLWPQLERSLGGLADELDRRGFDVFRTAAFAEETDDEMGDGKKGDGKKGDGGERDTGKADDGEHDGRDAVLFLELAVSERPAVERHEGPPVHVRTHAERFYEAYEDGDACGPFIDGQRYVVERDREFTTAVALLESDALFDVALGAHVASSLRDGYEVLAGDAVAGLAGQFGEQLAAYLSPTPRDP